MKKLITVAQILVVLTVVITTLAWGDPVLIPWSSLTGTPTTLSGYGITDGASVVTTFPWDNVTSRPTINGVTVTGTVLDNVLNYPSALARLASPTFTGTVTIPTPFTLGAVSVTPTGTELNYLVGVTDLIQGQLDDKQAGSSTLADVSDGVLTAPLVFNDDVYAKFGTDNDFTVRYKSADGTLVIALDNADAMCTFTKTGGLTCAEITGSQFSSSGMDNTYGINVMNTDDPSGANLEGGMFWFKGGNNTIKQRNADNTATITVNKEQESFVIYNYSASHDNVVRWRAASKQTLAQLDCNTGGTDNVTVTLYECDANVANCSTTGLVSAATSSTATDSSASDGDIDVDDWIKVSLSTLQGSATSVACTVTYYNVGN